MFVNFFTLTILSMSKFFSDDRFPSSEATKMSIGEMINRIDDRDLQVPEYQREFVWNKKQTQGYLDSLSRCMPLFGPVVNLNTETGDQSIMDGQNRIPNSADETVLSDGRVNGSNLMKNLSKRKQKLVF